MSNDSSKSGCVCEMATSPYPDVTCSGYVRPHPNGMDGCCGAVVATTSTGYKRYCGHDAACHPAAKLDREPLQTRVQPWMMACFGAEIAADTVERNHRFLEESLELVQSLGCTKDEAHMLVDYVFGRPAGDPVQEVGGVMITLAALCLANGLDMHEAGEIELARIWTKVDQIRKKQEGKPRNSPLPGPSTTPAQDDKGSMSASAGARC